MESLSGQAELAVILVNWRGAEDTIECLESLLRCPVPMRIIICDNASGDGSVERIARWAQGAERHVPKSAALAHLTNPPVPKPLPLQRLDREDLETAAANGAGLTLVQTGANLGFAGGNNLGLRLALKDSAINYIWFLNNDTVVDPGAPAAMMRALSGNPATGMAGSVIRFYHRPERLQLLNGSRYSPWTGRGYPIAGNEPANLDFDPDSVARETDFVCGASLAVTRQFAEQIGSMEESYFLYYEEIDWAVRGRGRFQIGFAPDAVVYHKEGGSIGSSRQTDRRSTLSEYYLARSKILFGRKHDRLKVPSLISHNMLLALRRMLQGHFDKAGAILIGTINRPFRGEQ